MIGLEEWDWTFMRVLLYLLSYRSQASINGVGMGCYHLLLVVEFPCAPNPL
jgi:hypothetical protein